MPKEGNSQSLGVVFVIFFTSAFYAIASDLRHPACTVKFGGLAGLFAALALCHRRFFRLAKDFGRIVVLRSRLVFLFQRPRFAILSFIHGGGLISVMWT
ncbi:hypothetical protein F5Y11DRAFT_171313 [Daldinia sp. FL1419]|nr:hypothetical protein F5Y11DRAFT_171313 [Daldinia sp. FL1419]